MSRLLLSSLIALYMLGALIPSALAQAEAPAYKRNAFASWLDADGDCLNTRHELLAELSTGPITMSKNGCRVVRGRWNDPYSGRIILASSQIDIDHLVPLKWAWVRGASNWSDAKRDRFANDPINLFAVARQENRSKGAKGPDIWLPSNSAFHCQYVTRFLRVLILYDFSDAEQVAVQHIRDRVC